MKKVLCLLLLVFAGFAGTAETITFKLNWIGDSIVLGSGLALTAGGLFLHPDVPAFDGKIRDINSINPFDRLAVNSYSKPLAITGDVFQYISILMPAVMLLTPTDEWLTLGVMYLESALFAFGIKEILKTAVQRERPYMYHANPPSDKISEGDYMQSFPSGHTTMAFNGAVFASYVFAARFPDSPFKIPVIAGSLALATTTAVMRVLSGNHFMTDVFTGAIIGSLSGFLVPWFHSIKPKDDRFEIAFLPAGCSVTMRF